MKSIKLPSNLGRLCISRVAEGPASTAHHCDNPEALAAYWTESVASAPDYNPDQERIVVVLLNTRLRPIGWHLIALGTCNECLVRVADILRPSVVCSCYGFAVIHNHPSGDVTPSEADRRLTRRVSEASALIGIRMVDHVSMTEPSRLAAGDRPFFSFREVGLVC